MNQAFQFAASECLVSIAFLAYLALGQPCASDRNASLITYLSAAGFIAFNFLRQPPGWN